ncbi:cupin domain-containing protein [Patescibacteria group bacterium]|nr:cupin domain-containing protein [Patescibacteria group bacterium]
MYKQGFYKNLHEDEIAKKVKKEGFDPIKISDPPGRIYSRHTHPETKLLAFLEGSMEVRVGDETFQCKAGDKVIVDGNVKHSAVVGPEGCTFFWSEKLM